MLIPVPIGRKYTVVASGAVLKFVRCERCGGEYAYEMRRKVEGTGNSILCMDDAGAAERAQTSAADKLAKSLDRDCDPVPCPDCSIYQRQMIWKMRRRRMVWFLGAWAAAWLVFIFCVGSGQRRGNLRMFAIQYEPHLWWTAMLSVLAGAGVILCWNSNWRAAARSGDYARTKGAIRSTDVNRWIAEQSMLLPPDEP